jgi:hypothetical protein
MLTEKDNLYYLRNQIDFFLLTSRYLMIKITFTIFMIINNNIIGHCLKPSILGNPFNSHSPLWYGILCLHFKAGKTKTS